MNYYEHHLGDYAKKTLHLTMLEDGAYRRLLDVYYTKELPLPLESKEIYRLVRAQNKADRASVDAVLLEFFQKKEDGWHHNRCDEEIARYAESQVGNDEKREHDKERQRRARDRRKALFSALREQDLVPPWDTKTTELEAMLSRVTGRDESQTGHGDGHAPVTPPVTRDNTATHGSISHTHPHTQPPDPDNKTTDSFDLLAESKPVATEPLSEFLIPLVDGTDYQPTVQLVGEWTAAYPAVDVPQELREMRTWALANKPKRKTRRGVDSFIVKWLGKTQDNPGARKAFSAQEQETFV